MIKGVLLLVVGRLSDLVGRRWFLIIGQTVATAGSIISALAPTVEVLIGGTVLIAIGGSVALLYPLLCQEMVPNKYRAYSQALITVTCFPFLGFGAAIGRTLVNTTSLGWRSVLSNFD
jgi:MFS family permease